jgi:hypothetical protein
MEEYKTCFETYEISNLGNCRRLLNDGTYKVVKGSILHRGGGYRYFQIARNAKKTNILFHHCVAEQFIGSRPDGLVIDHIDRNSLNNRVENLRYVSQQENCRNQHRVVEDIPFDEHRKQSINKRWRKNNKDRCIENKKLYYETHKKEIAEKDKLKGNIPIECSLCKNSRSVSYSMYNYQKRKGLENNICKTCSCRINLLKKVST